MSLPYHHDCPACDAVRSYLGSIDRGVAETSARTGRPTLVGVTINAEDIPHCPEHLGDEMGLISLNEAAACGIERVRLGHWTEPGDYIRIQILDGELGPKFQIYSRSFPSMGIPNPVVFSWEAVGARPDDRLYRPYEDGKGS